MEVVWFVWEAVWRVCGGCLLVYECCLMGVGRLWGGYLGEMEGFWSLWGDCWKGEGRFYGGYGEAVLRVWGKLSVACG